jgi:hypothetical protein
MNGQNKNLIFVKDILTDKGNFLTEKNVNTRFNISLNLLEYNGIKCAIPQRWKKRIKNECKQNPYNNTRP